MKSSLCAFRKKKKRKKMEKEAADFCQRLSKKRRKNRNLEGSSLSVSGGDAVAVDRGLFQLVLLKAMEGGGVAL